MIDIDKLRYNWEKPFLDLMEEMERKVDLGDPHKTLWYKDDGWYFEQDEKNGQLWCQYDRVWSFFEIEYGGNYVDIQSIIRNLMERHYNLRGLTPAHAFSSVVEAMEKHYKLRGLTPPDRFTRK